MSHLEDSDFTDEDKDVYHDSAVNVIDDSFSDDSDDDFIKRRSQITSWPKKREPVLTSGSDSAEDLILPSSVKEPESTQPHPHGNLLEWDKSPKKVIRNSSSPVKQSEPIVSQEEQNGSSPIKPSEPIVPQEKSFSERRESRLIFSDSEEETEILNFPSITSSKENNMKTPQNKSNAGTGLSTIVVSQSKSFLERRESQLISSSDDETERLSYPEWTKSLTGTGEKNKNNLDGSPKLNLSVASGDFHIEGELGIANSTTLDVGNKYGSKLSSRLSTSTKRYLNRSVDTPRILKQMKESTTPVTPQVVKVPSFSDDEDVIEVSSDEGIIQITPKTPSNKDTINPKISKTPVIKNVIKKEPIQTELIKVSSKEYQIQNYKVKNIQEDIHKAVNVMRTINLEHLPDKGLSIKNRQAALETILMQEVSKLSRMVITEEHSNEQPGISTASNMKTLTWAEIEAKAGAVQPRTFGKQAMSTYNAQKAVTMDKLQKLHESLKTRPSDDVLAEAPKGLKVTLMEHQRHALAWMMWREKQKPSGGILADDMGLGKTLTMISLIMKTKEANESESDESDTENESKKSSKPVGGTLVICPASLINQWSSELERMTKRGLLSYEMYHGPKREVRPKRLSNHDMVITTYAIINNECDKNGAVFRVKWRRIIMDEAHQVRNHKSQTSEAVCKLPATSRWALTGTPVHNKELDMYALLKFLRLSPFDDLPVWKRWVSDRSSGGTERLHTVISSIMLRRTKAELMEKGTLNSLPERNWQLIPVQLTKSELDIYNRILIFSRTLFAQFLHQRAEKNQDVRDLQFTAKGQIDNAANQEYFKMRQKLLRLHRVKEVKQHEILVLLLRLRQICCHASLITGMLHEDMPDIVGGDDDDNNHAAELDILEQLNNLTIDDDAHNPLANFETNNEEAAGLNEVARGLLNPNNPVFSKERASSKIKVMLNTLKEKVLNNNDKAIIISQWSSFLRLIAIQLKNEGICFDQLDGSVMVNKRMELVTNFNDPQHKMKVLLLSLTAGGVGLNLIGANHLFLLDLHWNPQLESQAQDRIYRVGQTKPVFIYKFMATDTIEKRILDLQEKKLGIANSMLTGTKQAIANKLSLQDLKMLFEM